MNELKFLTLDELYAKRQRIIDYCEGWLKCNDGSYEYALDAQGYYEVIKEIRIREAQ